MKDIQGKGFKTMAEYELDQKKQIEKRKADALKFAIDSIEGDIKSATTLEAVSALRNFMSRFDVFKDPVNKDAVEKLKNKLYEKQDNIGAILFYKKIGIKDFGYCRAANNWSLNHPFEFLGQMTVGGKHWQ